MPTVPVAPSALILMQLVGTALLTAITLKNGPVEESVYVKREFDGIEMPISDKELHADIDVVLS